MDINLIPNPYKVSYDNNEGEISKTKILIKKLEKSILENKKELILLKEKNYLLTKKKGEDRTNFIENENLKKERKKKLIDEINLEKNKLNELEENIKTEKKIFIESKKKNLSNLENQIIKFKKDLDEYYNFYNTQNYKISIQNGFFKMQINLIQKKINKLKNDYQESYLDRFMLRTRNFENIINFEKKKKIRKREIKKLKNQLSFEIEKQNEFEVNSQNILQKKIIEVNQQLKKYKNNNSYTSEIINLNQEVNNLEKEIKTQKNNTEKNIQKIRYDLKSLHTIDSNETNNCLNSIETNTDFEFLLVFCISSIRGLILVFLRSSYIEINETKLLVLSIFSLKNTCNSFLFLLVFMFLF